MILASYGTGVVLASTKHEMDLLEKDTKPKGWWMRERILFCVKRDTTILSLYCGLVQPMCKPEGRSIPSLRELTVQIALWQRACKNRAEATGFCSVDPARIGHFKLSFRCLVFTRYFLAQCHAHPNNKGIDDLCPPQFSHLFSLFLNDEKASVQVSLWWESQKTMYNRSTLNSGWPQAPQEGYRDRHHVHLCS